jgi:ABC-type sugar transport system permease subunit
MAAIRSRVLPNTRQDVSTSKFRRELDKNLTALVCIVPGMTVFFLFLLIPMVQSARYSLYDWGGFGPPTDYVGLHNYDLLFHNQAFIDAVRHSFVIMFLSLGIQLPMAMILALMVGRGQLLRKSLIPNYPVCSLRFFRSHYRHYLALCAASRR